MTQRWYFVVSRPMSMTDLKPEQDGYSSPKEWYLGTFDARDAELIRLRDSFYKGEFERMITEYEGMQNDDSTDTTVIDDTLQRLYKLRQFEIEVSEQNTTLDGKKIELSDLVDNFERYRRKKHATIELPNTYVNGNGNDQH